MTSCCCCLKQPQKAHIGPGGVDAGGGAVLQSTSLRAISSLREPGKTRAISARCRFAVRHELRIEPLSIEIVEERMADVSGRQRAWAYQAFSNGSEQRT